MSSGTAIPISAGATRLHLTATALGAANAATPTLLEAQTYFTAQGTANATVYYTGDDDANSSPIYIYDVNGLGEALLVKEPSTYIPPLEEQVYMDADKALTTWDKFYRITGSTSNWTLTMPPSSAADNGGEILNIYNESSDYITLAADAADTIVAAPTSLLLPPHSAATVRSTSVGIFNQIHIIGTGRGISNVASENGYSILTDDVMLQWGVVTLATETQETVNFHTAFGSPPFYIDLSNNVSSTGQDSGSLGIHYGTTTESTFDVNLDSTAAAGEYKYFAIGPVA